MPQTPLESEILKSEKLRTTILALLFILLSLMWASFAVFSRGQYLALVGEISTVVIPSFLAIVALYFVLMRQVICRYIQLKKNVPLFLRYLNTFIEMSIPTVGIIIVSIFRTPAYVLITPPILIYTLFIILSALTLDERICVFSGFVAAIEYWALSYFVLYHTDVSKIDPYLVGWYTFVSRGIVLLAGGFATRFIVTRIKQQLRVAFNAQEERDMIERIFGQHVSPQVAAKLLSEDAHGSENIPVCIMFLDIRNFSQFTEQNQPEVVVRYLNKIFQYMVEIIHENHGIINKFLGDGFMAVFGAPLSSGNDVANATKSALEIIRRTENEIKKGNIYDLKLGIGLHFGNAVTGTIGTKRRLEYTIVGDVVNSAAHIEQLNKKYNSSILISEAAMSKLPGIEAEFVGNVTLKRRGNPIKLYKLM
jgi:adenylate cyclase